MLNVGIIGDYDETKLTHPATAVAIIQAAQTLEEVVNVRWVDTTLLEQDLKILDPYDALLAGPGTPYVSSRGALAGIQYARERQRPFLGT